MAFNIDLDRGVHMRSHPASGMDIYMYVDDPGVYLSAHGNQVDDKLAEASGFPVEEFAKKRRIKLALAAAHDKVLQELQESEGTHNVVAEKEGFQMVDIGMDRFQVLSPDGEALNTHPLPKHDAEILLEQLVPDKVK